MNSAEREWSAHTGQAQCAPHCLSAQAFCGSCAMCKSEKTNLCGAVRKWTGNGIMRADDDVRFHHKETGKKIYHFVRAPFPSPVALLQV